jgi:hypothetical protein
MLRIDVCTLQSGGDCRLAELVRGHCSKAAVEGTDRGPGGGDNDDICHVVGLLREAKALG